MKYITTVNGKTFEIEVSSDGRVRVNGTPRAVDFLPLGDALYSVVMDAASHEVVVETQDPNGVEVLLGGRLFTGTVLDERAQLLRTRRGGQEADSGEVTVRAPMPGLVVAVPVSEGQPVKKGETVVVLESMKMQNELKAPRDGTVQRVGVQTGQSVEQNKVLVTLT